MKLLFALDHSVMSQAIIDQATRRPWPKDTTACVLHVIETLPLRDGTVILRELRDAASAWLNPAAEMLRKASIPTSIEIIEGLPRMAVSDFAKEWGADFVMIGSHGASGLVRFLLGGVAQATLRSAPCSVEIVRASMQSTAPSAPMKVLLAADGSEFSVLAAKSIGQRPWPAGTQLQIVSVSPVIAAIPETMPWAPSYYPSPELIETVQTEMHRRSEEAVARAKQVLLTAGAKFLESECLPVGDARQVLLDEADKWGADLIVLGSHGRHGFSRFMLGSVSEAVAVHAHCSVEVIRERY